MLDLTDARYEAVSDVAVKVTHSTFHHAKTYTNKLEGAERVGYQSILIGSVRDPFIIRQIDNWLERLMVKIHDRVASVFGDKLDRKNYLINVRIYGKNGTMGPLEPVSEIRGHEICLLFEMTGATQKIANTLGSIVRHQALHLPIPEWSGLVILACLGGGKRRTGELIVILLVLESVAYALFVFGLGMPVAYLFGH